MSEAQTTVISGGLIATDYGTFQADLVIRGELVAAISTDASDVDADHRIDASGLLVIPGGIDVHTHFEEPDPNLLEGFVGGGSGAVAGGITSVVEMPQAHPTTTTLDLLREKQAIVAEKAIVDMALWGGVVPGQDPGVIQEMVGAGVVGLKSFMASSSPFFAAVNDADLFMAMKTISELNVPYALHAESDALVRSGLDRMASAGRKDPLAHADSRPPLVEDVAVNTALYLAEKTGCWIHICHVASSEALRQIADARARGVRVTCETCPQYLSLNTDDLTVLAGFGRCAPAIRPQEEVDAIWPYVMSESVDFVCSDHCGFTMQRKAEGAEDIFAAPMGLSGIQTLLPVFFDGAVVQRGMPLEQFVRQISTNAAKFADVYPQKGTIRVGSDADIVLLDPNQTWTVRGADMLHRNLWSPFEGKQVTGRVVRTIRRGETVYDDALIGAARVPAKPGSGSLLPRGYGRDTA